MQNQKPVPCKGIITYRRFKNDHGVSFALLRTYGKKKYPGIEKAPFLFWDVSQGTPDGRSAEEWETEGYVLVGIANSKYDDHDAKHRGEKTCCAHMVAKDLEIFEAPYLKNLLDFTLLRDMTGCGHFMMIMHTLKLMHDAYSKSDPAGIMEWYLQALELYIENEHKVFVKTPEEFKRSAKIHKCSHRGREVRVAVVVSDNTSMGRYARNKEDIDVVIQKNSNGNVIIMTKTSTCVDLDETIELIRCEEIRAQNIQVSFSKERFTSAGTLKEIKEWYYDRNSRAIYNGSENATTTPPTKISFERLVSMVISGLKRTRYQHESNNRRNVRA